MPPSCVPAQDGTVSPLAASLGPTGVAVKQEDVDAMRAFHFDVSRSIVEDFQEEEKSLREEDVESTDPLASSQGACTSHDPEIPPPRPYVLADLTPPPPPPIKKDQGCEIPPPLPDVMADVLPPPPVKIDQEASVSKSAHPIWRRRSHPRTLGSRG